MKRFGETAFGSCLDAANSHQPEEHLLVEPILGGLAGKVFVKQFDLAFRVVRRDFEKGIRRPKIAFVLRNFEAEDEMVAKGIRYQFGERSMVLMLIVERMGEYDVRVELRRNAMDKLFCGFPLCRKVALA